MLKCNLYYIYLQWAPPSGSIKNLAIKGLFIFYILHLITRIYHFMIGGVFLGGKGPQCLFNTMSRCKFSPHNRIHSQRLCREERWRGHSVKLVMWPLILWIGEGPRAQTPPTKKIWIILMICPQFMGIDGNNPFKSVFYQNAVSLCIWNNHYRSIW